MRNCGNFIKVSDWILDPSTSPYGSAQDDIIDIMLRMT